MAKRQPKSQRGNHWFNHRFNSPRDALTAATAAYVDLIDPSPKSVRPISPGDVAIAEILNAVSHALHHDDIVALQGFAAAANAYARKHDCFGSGHHAIRGLLSPSRSEVLQRAVMIAGKAQSLVSLDSDPLALYVISTCLARYSDTIGVKKLKTQAEARKIAAIADTAIQKIQLIRGKVTEEDIVKECLVAWGMERRVAQNMIDSSLRRK